MISVKKNNMETKHIYLVRHGQTNANAKEYVPGKQEPLNEVGLLQAAQLAERVDNLDVDTLIRSDYLRAGQTMEPTAAEKKMEPEIVPAFGEMFEPTSLHGVSDEEDVVQNYRKDRNANIENEAWSYEDGESFFDMQARVNEAREYLESHPSSNILVVSHAFFLCFFIGSILLDTRKPTKDLFNVAITLQKSNTGISYLKYKDGKWQVIVFNDHAHFAE